MSVRAIVELKFYDLCSGEYTLFWQLVWLVVNRLTRLESKTI